MLESAARPHRSKKVRPCDRCRKRKARCDVLKAGDACISCSVSKSACTFADPVLKKPLRPSAVVFDASASSSTLPGPSNPALIAQIIESVTTADQISPSSGLHGLLKDALSAVDSVPAQSGEDLFTETDAVRLDLELDEEVEVSLDLCLVGSTEVNKATLYQSGHGGRRSGSTSKSQVGQRLERSFHRETSLAGR